MCCFFLCDFSISTFRRLYNRQFRPRDENCITGAKAVKIFITSALLIKFCPNGSVRARTQCCPAKRVQGDPRSPRLDLHAVAHPVEQHADKGIGIHPRDECLILLTHGHPGSKLVDHAHQEVIGQRREIALDLLAADTAVYVHDEDLVCADFLKDLQKALLPGLRRLLACQCTGRILNARPLHKVIDVLEMIVKGHAVDPAVLGDVRHRDLVQRAFRQQVFQRRFQRPFRDLRHTASQTKRNVHSYYTIPPPSVQAESRKLCAAKFPAFSYFTVWLFSF